MDPMELRMAVSAAALAVSGLVIAGLAAAALGTARAALKWPVPGRRPKRTLPRRIGIAVGVVVFGVAAGMGASLIRLPDGIDWYWPVVGAAAIGSTATLLGAVKLANKIELSALINSPSPSGGDPQTVMPPHPTQPSVSDRLHDTGEFAYGQPYPGLVSAPDGPSGQPPASLAPSPSSSPEIVASHRASAELHTTTPLPESPAIGPSHSVGDDKTPRPDILPPDATPGWVYADADDNWYMVLTHVDRLRLMRLADFTLVDESEVVGNLHVGGGVDITVWPVDTEPPTAQEQDERRRTATDSPALPQRKGTTVPNCHQTTLT